MKLFYVLILALTFTTANLSAQSVDSTAADFDIHDQYAVNPWVSVPVIALGGVFGGVKHYPTDVAIGLGVGAISGILVPELHRWWDRRHKSKMILRPVYGNGAAGAGFSLVF